MGVWRRECEGWIVADVVGGLTYSFLTKNYVPNF